MSRLRIISRTENHRPDTHTFSVHNFIVTEEGKIPARMQLDKNFVFDGIVLLICREGRGRIKIDYREHTLTRNKVLVIFPYSIVRLIDKDDDFIFAVLFLGIEFITKSPLQGKLSAILKLGRNPLIDFTDEQIEGLMEIHALVLSRFKKLHRPYQEINVAVLIGAMLLEIGLVYRQNSQEMKPRRLTRQEQITERFFVLMIENFKQNRTVAFYADRLCLTPKYLSDVVKKTTGYTIQQWINEIVIFAAKNLLTTTDLTVMQIAEELNFANPSFFGRFFKQYTGYTPRQFRFV